MKFVVWLLVCVVCVAAEESPPPAHASPGEAPAPSGADRAARFLNLKQLYHSSVETNEISPERKEDPNTALQGLYTDCVLQFSLPCLQKKFLVFLDKLGRMEGFSILGDFLSVKRTTKETTKPISEKVIEARMNSEGELDALVEYAIDRFFSTHKLQLKLPFGLSVVDDTETGRSSTAERTVDLVFPQGYSEGRGKKKKMLMMMIMMAKAKLALLVPLAVILVKIKAVKALLFAKIALLLSVFGALGKAGLGAGAIGLGGKLGGLGGGLGGGGGGGGHGGGGYGGGGGGYGGGGGEKQKIVIIHDPHHATSGGGGGGGGGHSHGHGGGGGGGHHGGGGGGDSYGPPSGGGGGGWSSGGGGDSYSGGHDSGGWGRSWSPSDAQTLAYRRANATDRPT